MGPRQRRGPIALLIIETDLNRAGRHSRWRPVSGRSPLDRRLPRGTASPGWGSCPAAWCLPRSAGEWGPWAAYPCPSSLRRSGPGRRSGWRCQKRPSASGPGAPGAGHSGCTPPD